MVEEWFYWANDRECGPVSEAELRTMAQAGRLRPEDLVWNRSMREWLPAGRATDWTFGPAPAPDQAAAPALAVPTLSYPARSDEALVLSPRVLDLLLKTRPWVRFFAILTYVAAGLFVLAGLSMMVIAILKPRVYIAGIGVGVLYILLGVLYSFPAGYLNKFASHITALNNMRRNVNLEDALDAQRAFWKFCGVLAIVMLGFYAIAIGIAVAVR